MTPGFDLNEDKLIISNGQDTNKKFN